MKKPRTAAIERWSGEAVFNPTQQGSQRKQQPWDDNKGECNLTGRLVMCSPKNPREQAAAPLSHHYKWLIGYIKLASK